MKVTELAALVGAASSLLLSGATAYKVVVETNRTRADVGAIATVVTEQGVTNSPHAAISGESSIQPPTIAPQPRRAARGGITPAVAAVAPTGLPAPIPANAAAVTDSAKASGVAFDRVRVLAGRQFKAVGVRK
jgi:hypothetical protein